MVTIPGTSQALTWRACQQEALDAITADGVRARSCRSSAGGTRSKPGRVGCHGPTMWTACDLCERVLTRHAWGATDHESPGEIDCPRGDRVRRLTPRPH